jgi:uncharacterized damage-inducible protein DinB
MVADAELRDLLALTARYYGRLRELLSELPEGGLSLRVGGRGLTAAETIRHVCASDLWYMDRIDGGTRPAEEAADDPEALEAALTRSEQEMTAFLEALRPEQLGPPREVPAWWAAGAPVSVRLILTHSLAHKYYHCGQLQAILHAAASGGDGR